ncbi:choice-of-anchor Q domain-containing protein, partial [Singulisphaera rosea]
PALDAATGVAAGSGRIPTDLRGSPRPQGPALDLGAFESPAH